MLARAWRAWLGIAVVLADSGCAAQTATAPAAKAPEAVLKAIRAHQKQVPPDLWRYRGLTIYGETLSGTAPGKEAMATEVELLASAKAAGLFASLPPEVRALGHNVVVRAPAQAQDYLDALQAAGGSDDRQLGGDLFSTMSAAGEAGERRIVAGLRSEKGEIRRFWVRYLSRRAIYTSSVAPIEQQLATEPDAEVRASLLDALDMIGAPSSLACARRSAEQATDDLVQKAALSACVDLGGRDAREFISGVKPVGPRAAAEQKEGLAWLERETSEASPHGRSVGSDREFAGMYGDLASCPTMVWLAEQKLLEEDALARPPKLDAAKKQRLFELLLDSKGFGLEAVKGALFRSLSKDDEATLLRLRAAAYWSPNDLSAGRVKTLDIMVRHVRQEL